MQFIFHFSTKTYLSAPANTISLVSGFLLPFKKQWCGVFSCRLIDLGVCGLNSPELQLICYQCLQRPQILHTSSRVHNLVKPSPLCELTSVYSFSVAHTRYLSIFHVSSPPQPPPIHPINSNSHASLQSAFLISIVSAFLEHLLT